MFAFFAMFGMAIACILAALTRNWVRLKLRAGQLGIYLVVFACCIGIFVVFDNIAKKRSELVLQAVVQFEAQTGEYPQTIEALTPTLLDNIDPAMPTIFSRGVSNIDARMKALCSVICTCSWLCAITIPRPGAGPSAISPMTHPNPRYYYSAKSSLS